MRRQIERPSRLLASCRGLASHGRDTRPSPVRRRRLDVEQLEPLTLLSVGLAETIGDHALLKRFEMAPSGYLLDATRTADAAAVPSDDSPPPSAPTPAPTAPTSPPIVFAIQIDAYDGDKPYSTLTFPESFKPGRSIQFRVTAIDQYGDPINIPPGSQLTYWIDPANSRAFYMNPYSGVLVVLGPHHGPPSPDGRPTRGDHRANASVGVHATLVLPDGTAFTVAYPRTVTRNLR